MYGINFGLDPIPPGVARKFAKQIKVDGKRLTLTGVAQSEDDRARMLVQADNGHRTLHVVARATAGGTWFGIYS